MLDIDIYTSVESLPKTSKTDSTFNDWASEQQLDEILAKMEEFRKSDQINAKLKSAQTIRDKEQSSLTSAPR